MKNNFTVEVLFGDVPLYPYEWAQLTLISGVEVKRVNTSMIRDVLTYDAILSIKNQIVILSDSKTSIVLRLNKEGKITKRGFLTFATDADICEFASNLKPMKIEYKLLKRKLKYGQFLNEEVKMKEFVVSTLNNIKDEFESKYLYYLFFNEVENYSKERLIDFIRGDKPGNFKRLYDYLITK